MYKYANRFFNNLEIVYQQLEFSLPIVKIEKAHLNYNF